MEDNEKKLDNLLEDAVKKKASTAQEGLKSQKASGKTIGQGWKERLEELIKKHERDVLIQGEKTLKKYGDPKSEEAIQAFVANVIDPENICNPDIRSVLIYS